MSYAAARGAVGVLELLGSGRTGIVLSHMENPVDRQADRYGVAHVLAERGYVVLTYDRRGVCPRGIDVAQ